MKNQPVLYESLKTILSHLDANLRINMSLRMPSIHATEKAVPLKTRWLSITDTTVEINDVRYELGVYRDHPNRDVPHGVENDFDRFGFEIPFGSSPILPGDISVRTDTDERHRRHNLPSPFNRYIQLSTMEDGEATPLQRLAYTRKLYEAVKQFNHILFADRPAIQVNELVCLANHAYRIPVGLISANELTVRQSQIASIATMLKGDVNKLRVIKWENVENWWQHSFVKNTKELITEDSPSMFRTLRNKIIKFINRRILTTEQYCELIEIWMSAKREDGLELWIGLDYKIPRKMVLKMIQARMEVIRRDERCVRVLGENGTRVEVCEEVCVGEAMHHHWAVKVKIIEN